MYNDELPEVEPEALPEKKVIAEVEEVKEKEVKVEKPKRRGREKKGEDDGKPRGAKPTRI